MRLTILKHHYIIFLFLTSYLYSATTFNSIVVSDPSTGKIVNVFSGAFSNSPAAIGFANNQGYICNFLSPSVSIINPITGASLGSVSDPNQQILSPYNIAFSSDGTQGYVCNYLHNTVTVFSTSSNSVTSSIIVGNAPRDIAIQGTTAYVVNALDATVSVINTSNNTVTNTITLPAVTSTLYWISVSNSGIAVISGGNNVYFINTNTNTLIGYQNYSNLLDISDILLSGTTAYASCTTQQGYGIAVIDASLQTITNIITNSAFTSLSFGLAIINNTLFVANFYGNYSAGAPSCQRFTPSPTNIFGGGTGTTIVGIDLSSYQVVGVETGFNSPQMITTYNDNLYICDGSNIIGWTCGTITPPSFSSGRQLNQFQSGCNASSKSGL